MIDISKLPYRKGVGMVLLNKDNKVFVGKRVDTKSEAWQMPQGGIDKGETDDEAVLRELAEEVGTNKVEIISKSKYWYNYDLPEALVPKVWNGKYKGQRQKWFLIRFIGDDSDVNIATEHQEFCEWKWVDFEELLDMIVPFKREIYSYVMDEFRQLI